LEIIQRINHPIKQILVAMKGSADTDMSNNIVQFCVSWTSINHYCACLCFEEICAGLEPPLYSRQFWRSSKSTHRNTTQVSTLNVPSTDKWYSSLYLCWWSSHTWVHFWKWPIWRVPSSSIPLWEGLSRQIS